MENIDAMMMSTNEKTFQYQNELPSLPVPPLEQTIRKYLDSVKPFLTNEEYQATEHLCWKFAHGEGQFLHDKLVLRSKQRRNWLQEWWEDSYFETRLPAPLMNMFGPGPYIYDIWKPETGTQIPRTAMLLFFTLQFWQSIRREQLKPQKDGKGTPLCMEQFHRLFNTCKIPGVLKDHLVEHFHSELEGACPSHVVVMCKGHVFSFQCLDDQNNLLTVPELQAQLQKIIDRAALLPEASGMHYFTALERTSWAEVRSHLLALHPENFHTLEKIEECILVMGLDDDSPSNADDLSLKALFGNPLNKWLDKTLNFISFKNGTFATTCDHSPIDGMMLVFCTYYVHCKILECKGQWKGSRRVRSIPEPEYLHFHLDNNLCDRIPEAKENYTKLSQSVEDVDRLKLFKSAVVKHNQLMQEATALEGCDRHLYGLAMIAREEGLETPQIFVDPAFSRRLTFLITSWTADKDTSAIRLAEQICQALRDMKMLLEQKPVSNSHL
ncbi:hypothetical protein C0Q70_10268 [Pomacea canaliculata]|uniref:Peroxisomal carnitine O-octanoyltransferase n=1 Tax=Pomacea canaliculata TaxID=400727 RepID=A0A2T7PC54_POMCA|nr:hypothetical protein C0Q70_10268 [Pomacea canaliculata]